MTVNVALHTVERKDKAIKTHLLSNLSAKYPIGICATTPPIKASERNIPICNCVNPLSCPNTGPNILIAGLVAPTTKTVIKLSGDSTKVFDRFNEGEFGTVGGMFVVNASGKIHKHKRSEIVL